MTTSQAPGQAPKPLSLVSEKKETLGEKAESVIKGTTDAVHNAAKKALEGANLSKRVDGAVDLVEAAATLNVNPKRGAEAGFKSIEQIVTGKEIEKPGFVEVVKDNFAAAVDVAKGSVQAQFGSPIKGSKRMARGASTYWSGRKAA